MQPRVILMGWVTEGGLAKDGESMKNQILIARLRELGVTVDVMDFHHWKRHPQVLVKLLWKLMLHPKRTLILSSSPKNIYIVMKLHRWTRSRRKVIHWVIGGTIHNFVRQGVFKASYVKSLHINLVESPAMVEGLNEQGVFNVKQVTNFKPIEYIPEIPKREDGSPLRFVFLSRIMPDKGCDYILQSVRSLNESGLENRFAVTFYGGIKEDYKESFESQLVSLPNASYGGYLDFSKRESYDTLASYDMMLFPTYWKGEGFAGIFIDAFVAGLPIIASEWGHNRCFLTEGEDAIFVPVHDAKALESSMRECIEGKRDISAMRRNAQAKAMKFDTREVVTEQLLKEIGIL